MTTPGGVPNLPQGALTLETLSSSLQDMSGTAMKSRAVARFPSIFENSTGLSPASDITPFGILTRIWAEVNSLVANADPADIQGPEDLPPLVLEFIEGLPVVGQLVGLLEAILGTYDGDDEVLLEVQRIFALIRNILGGIDFIDPPTPEEAWQLVLANFINPVLDDLDARRQALLDALYNKFTGSTSIGHTVPELFDALDDIPGDLIRGLFGSGTLPAGVQKLVDAIVGGAVGESGTGADPTDVETFIAIISGKATRGDYAWTKAGIRNNQPIDNGIYPSERSNFPLSAITTQFTIAPGTSHIVFDYIEEDMAIGVISWIGWGVTGITGFHLNAYQVDLATGNLGELIHQSPNVVGVLAGTASPGAYMSYEPADPPGVLAGDLIAYELIVVGGSHTMRGRVSGLPVHPTAPVGAPAASRAVSSGTLHPASIPKTDLTWSQNVGWVGIAVDTGSGSDHHDPELRVLIGPATLPIPNWADAADIKFVSHGGDATDGFTGFFGNPGQPGNFNETTFLRGTHFDGTATVIVFDGTSVGIPGYSLTAPPGANAAGARAVIFGKPVGKGPGTEDYNGIHAIAAGDQAALGADGAGAGGGANGGTAFGLYSRGGNGGPSRAWIQFRKDLLPGETPGTGTGDTTPPDISGMTVEIESTFNSITITPSGAVDA